MSGAAAFWLLAAVTAALYLAMIFGTLKRIREDADGIAPFDLRRTGYGPEEARAFLAALSEHGRALYLGPQRLLDGVFLVLFTATLVAAINWAWERPWSLVFSAVAVAAGILDAVENVLVARMLRAGAGGVTDAEVRRASRTTVAKFALVGVSFAAIVLGAVL